MKTQSDLRRLLNAIDHRGYPAYKETRGEYQFDGYVLSIDHVQGDPFAAPSAVSLRVDGRTAAFPPDYYGERHRRIALQDCLTRRFAAAAERYSRRAGGSGRSGLIGVCEPGQEVLERTSCRILPGRGDVVFRLEVGFPANGRTINAGALIRILFEYLPACVEDALVYRRADAALYEDVLFLADDQRYIREQLPLLGLCAFVADGSILPRRSGVSDEPLRQAVAFRSPESLRVTLELPHRGALTGMGIRCGITLIVGGGFHGKSTLLRALERGVYDHVRGDGREYVITEGSAAKIRAEDGRCVHADDISLFINRLPDGRDTSAFSTEDASGSTSQAANVVEAVECGSRTLLMDEDTCATNFMVRDELMQRVVHRDAEPITPFLERMRDMYGRMGVSCVLVAGSSGAFFAEADAVIQMDCYVPRDITERAKAAAAEFAQSGGGQPAAFAPPAFRRACLPNPAFRADERVKTKVMGTDGFLINHEEVDLRYLEQLVDREQTAALARIVIYANQRVVDSRRPFRDVLDALADVLAAEGLEAVQGRSPGAGLAMPRRQEIAACLSRCREAVRMA